MNEDPSRDYYSEYADDHAGGENKYDEITRIGKAVTQADIQDRMYALWRQYPRPGYIGTYSTCRTQECGRSTRGAGLCKQCAANALCDTIGIEDGTRYHEAIQIIREIEAKHTPKDG